MPDFFRVLPSTLLSARSTGSRASRETPRPLVALDSQPPVSDELTDISSGTNEPAESPAHLPGPAAPASVSDPLDQLVPTELLVSSRRGFLRGAIAAAGGAVVAGIATTAPAWSYSPVRSIAEGAVAGHHEPPILAEAGAPSPAAAVGGPIPAGWTEDDVAAREKIRRFVGNLAEPLGLAPFIGQPDAAPEFTMVPHGNQPLAYRKDGDAKVFDLTVDEIEWQVDAFSNPLKALGYNGMMPGPLLRVVEGDRVKVNVRNNLSVTTGVHFHGQEPDDFRMDGVPFITQLPIVPGETFTYDFVAKPAGSHMYHSHHRSLDQVGRGLLGAFVVDPADPAERYDVDQEIIFIHNDMLGGFTINGHGFPATAPIVARKGERILIRYMNEGLFVHPWHTHGFRQHVVARDGAPLGSAAFLADTLTVAPGERWDAIVECERPGVWAFHCHILTHVDQPGKGMFGMVTALVITD